LQGICNLYSNLNKTGISITNIKAIKTPTRSFIVLILIDKTYVWAFFIAFIFVAEIPILFKFPNKLNHQLSPGEEY